MKETIDVGIALDDVAFVPKQASPYSSGYDLIAAESIEILPQSVKLVKTGIRVEIPVGYEMQVRSRSGLAIKNNVMVLNSPGTVDSDYRGYVGVILANFGNHTFKVNIGDRIAQAVFAPVMGANLIVKQTLNETDRGDGGFGSTGKN
jgi:dUTP pyrophosphatase